MVPKQDMENHLYSYCPLTLICLCAEIMHKRIINVIHSFCYWFFLCSYKISLNYTNFSIKEYTILFNRNNFASKKIEQFTCNSIEICFLYYFNKFTDRSKNIKIIICFWITKTQLTQLLFWFLLTHDTETLASCNTGHGFKSGLLYCYAQHATWRIREGGSAFANKRTSLQCTIRTLWPMLSHQ